jgi:hypothetical protein
MMLVNGRASWTGSSLGVGTHSIKAVYSGNTNFLTSTSPTLRETICKASPTISCTASLKTCATNQGVTFTASFNCSGFSPNDVVTFMDGNNVIGTGTCSVVGGVVQAKCTVSNLAVGTHSIKAVYAGNSNLNGCTSGLVSLSVTKAVTPAATPASQVAVAAANTASTSTKATDAVHGTSTGVNWRFY